MINPILKQYLGPDESIMIGLSGGVDSIYLTHSVIDFWRSQNRPTDHIYMGYYHHNMRSQANIEQTELADIYHSYNFITARYDGDRYDEKNLRIARYAWFAEMIQRYNIKYLLLGHHLDDRIETSLLHLERGAMLDGIRNMSIFQPTSLDMRDIYGYQFAGILRPMLYIPKNNIITQVQSKGLKYFHDHSNDDIYISQRNQLRHDISQHHNITQLQHSMSQIYSNLDDIYNQHIMHIYSIIEHIRYPKFTHISRAIRIQQSDIYSSQILYDILAYIGITAAMTQDRLMDIWTWIATRSSGYKKIHNYYIYICHSDVYIIKYLDDENIDPISSQDIYTQMSEIYGQERIDEYKDDIYMQDKLILAPQDSRIFGKTINTYLSDHKVPVFLRPYIPVLIDIDHSITHIFWGKFVQKSKSEYIAYI